jgi:hypothetical protein
MILSVLAVCIMVMKAFPETGTAQWLHKVLVEQPLEWLSNLKRRDIIFLLVMIALCLTAGEFVAVFGMSELFVLGANLSLYVDAVLVTTAATITATIATAWRSARAKLFTWRRPQRPRARSNARKTRPPKALGDEDAPRWGPAYAT